MRQVQIPNWWNNRERILDMSFHYFAHIRNGRKIHFLRFQQYDHQIEVNTHEIPEIIPNFPQQENQTIVRARPIPCSIGEERRRKDEPGLVGGKSGFRNGEISENDRRRRADSRWF